MADNYRPGLPPGRRDSAHYAQPPPPRPNPRRTMSNSVGLDPRRRPHPTANDPRKRLSSQSPEPGRPLKHTRTGQPTSNGAISPTTSRRSSMSSGAARDGSTRKPSAQLKPDLRKEAEGNMQSPISPSRGSGASTPQQASAAPVVNMGAPTVTGADAADSMTSSVLAALNMFASQVATQASLEASQRHANQSFERARTEYHGLERNFRQFPALQEKKKVTRDRTYEQFKQATEQIEQHKASGQALQNLATLITSCAKSAKPETELRTDAVSRADMEALTKRCDDMGTKHNNLSSSIDNIQSRLSSNEDAVAELKGIARDAAIKASDCFENSKQANSAAEEAMKAVLDASQVAKEARNSVADTHKVLDKVKTDAGEASKLANEAKRKVDDLTYQINNANDNANEALKIARDANSVAGQIPGIRTQINELNQDIKRLPVRKPDSEMAPQGSDSQERLDQLKGSIDAVSSELAAYKTSMSGPFALKKDLGDLESQCEKWSQDIGGIRKTELELKELKKDVEQIRLIQVSSKKQVNAADGFSTDYKERVDKIMEDGPKLVQAVDDMEKKSALLQNLIVGDEPVESVKINHGSLLGSTQSLKHDLQRVQSDLSAFSDSIEDADKGSIKDRFKKLDRAVNNLSTRVGDDKMPIPIRLKGIESRLEGLQLSVDSAKNGSAPVPQSQSSLEEGEIRSQQTHSYKEGQLGNLNARVPQLEDQCAELRVEFEDLKKQVRVDSPADHVSVGEAVKKRISNVEKELKRLNEEQLNKFTDAGNRLARVEKELKGLPEQQEEKDQILMDLVESTDRELRATLDNTKKQSKEEIARLEQLLALNMGKISEVEKAAKNNISKEAFGHYDTTSITPMRNHVHQLEAQFKQLQTQTARSNSMRAPQTPAVPQSPQMPNGVASPMNGSKRVPTPQQNQQPVPDIDRMQDQLDGVIQVQQHLKQRCDNVVTDDIVKHMTSQMSELFPEARNFSSAHKALIKRAEAVESEINALKQGHTSSPAEMHAMRSRVENVEKEQRATGLLVNRLEQDVVAVRNTTSSLSKGKGPSPAPAARPSSDVTQEDLKVLRTSLEEVDKVARAADLLSKGHSSRFSKLDLTKKQIDALDEMVKKNDDRVDDLEGKFKKVQKDVDDIAAETAKTNTTVAKLVGKKGSPS